MALAGDGVVKGSAGAAQYIAWAIHNLRQSAGGKAVQGAQSARGSPCRAARRGGIARSGQVGGQGARAAEVGDRTIN